MWFTSAANSQALLPNSSFEDGPTSPLGWNHRPGGAWATGAAHRGRQYLTGRATAGATVWESDRFDLKPGEDYRLEGWLRCPQGEGHLGVDLFGPGAGANVKVEAPAVRNAAGWRYVAVEWNAKQAVSARALFRVQGAADLDDVVIAPIAMSYLANGGVEGVDARGRIPFWNEEQTDSLLPGKRGGQFRSEAATHRSGKACLQLTPTADWFGFASVNWPAHPWTDRFRFSAWGRAGGAASAQLLAVWIDDMQKVVRVDVGPPIQGDRWQLLELTPDTRPANAMAVRLVGVARGGPAWFDDFNLELLRPHTRAARVLVNQVGYDLGGPKIVVIATNFVPRDGRLQLSLQTSAGGAAWSGEVECAGRIRSGLLDDWGWYFWRADCSSLRTAGTYRATAMCDSVRGESAPFEIAPGAVLNRTARNAIEFFFTQRCGYEVPGWHPACHLDDANLEDGKHLDLTGGWHSAGDYNKLMYENGDGGVVYALLSALQLAPGQFAKQQRAGSKLPDVLDEAHWGAQFVAKMQIPESGGLRNHVSQGPGRNWTKWSAPEVHTDNKVGTADDPVVTPGEGNSPLVIGAWARLSTLLDDRGVKNDYRERALRLWAHASKQGTQVGSPHLLLSALDLHSVTGDPQFAEYAARSVASLLAQQVATGKLRGAFGAYGELAAGALAHYALAHPQDRLVSRIKPALQEYLAFCVVTADNPFGLSMQSVAEPESFFPPDLGHNFQLLQRAWAAAAVFRITGDRRALTYATDHLDWVLGKNPLNLCMFEGAGTVNPPRYHHRYNMIPGKERGAVPGTIPNGVVRDMGIADRPGFDLSRSGGRSPSFRTSEPWLVHNMWYLLATSELQSAVSTR